MAAISAHVRVGNLLRVLRQMLSAHRLLALLFPVLLGCANNKSSQYFVAEDPTTGERAIYHLRIKNDGFGAQYHFTAAYLPKVAIDLYQGKVPQTLAEFNAQSDTGTAAVAQIQQQLREFLRKQAELHRRRHNDRAIADPNKLDRITLVLARLLSRSMWSTADWQSVGEEFSLDPYRYRRLVYFASTRSLRIQDFDTEAQNVETGLNAVAATLSKVAAAREAARADEQRPNQARLWALASLVKANAAPTDVDEFELRQIIKLVELIE